MHPSAAVGLLAFASAIEAVPTSNSLHGRATSAGSVSNLKDKIKNVVVLCMENRSLDNLLGGQTISGLDNPINNGPFCNPIDLDDASQGQVCSSASDYDSILNDPDHAIYGNNIEFYGTFTPDNDQIADGSLTPTQQGFVHEQLRLYDGKTNSTVLGRQVMNYYKEEQVPVFTSLVQNYLTFNHWHSDVPGPTNPNRAALTSGTSAGHGTNDDGFSTDNHALTQRSIFQQLSESNRTWNNYYTSDSMVDAYFYDWTFTSGNDDKAQPMSTFYQDAASGTLPQFSYIDPDCCGVGTNSMHPTGLISDGETFIKNIYDALRASPQWEQTLFVITFDETGGFHDHVAPPLAVRPDDLTYTASTPSGDDYTFEFNRLGGRLPTLLISPWVSKGFVEQQAENSDGDTVSYSASSLLRTLGYLWDFAPFTPRVEKAPSFHHLIQATKRTDTPTALPSASPFSVKKN
ncbi:hypothetical protein FE257_000174 [Aspergillus nanangensis]|uniref:Phosphoesterase n=1 Tax=Aspergillus nanangensis TaxID=2582783 RepID=A0AAD4GZS6_ASPNN|nr:hypothetical protein FE257_000174 [Aspergillus nanangensis]